jgi:pentatricopeptide repeat protein
MNMANDPNDFDDYIKLAEVFMHEARVTGEHGHYYPSALLVLNKVLEKEKKPTDIRFNALLYKASVMLSQHEFHEAKALSLEAMKINKYNAQLYGTLVDALVELGEYDDAVMMADKMVSLRPDLRSYARISYLREIYGDMNGAIEAMTMAAEAGYPGLEQTAWAKLTLGELYVKNKEFEKAALVFQQILEERENYPFAIAALGNLELEKKNYEGAEALLQKAANIIPEVGYYCDLAKVYKSTDRKAKFDETIEEILVMLKDDVDSGHNMNLEYADLYLNLVKNTDAAEKYALREYAKRPNNIDVNKMMAEILLSKNKVSQAQSHLDYILTINKNSTEVVKMKQELSMTM